MMNGFHEVRFPLRIALGTVGGPGIRTDITLLSNGRESRNARWRSTRRRYDAGSGVKSLDDLYQVLAFFEARGGQLNGFRFRDPVDYRSGAPGQPVTPLDQVIGTGDGVRQDFQLLKRYEDAGGASVRAIEKPVAGSLVMAVDGASLPAGAFSLDETSGLVTIVSGPPSVDASVTAGFEFDVPVRFDSDRIEIDLSLFQAGRIPTIPLVEIAP